MKIYIVIALLITAGVVGIISYDDGKIIIDKNKGKEALLETSKFIKDKIVIE